MGQSNSTSPLDAIQLDEQYKPFNYSRLINIIDDNKSTKQAKKQRQSFNGEITNLSNSKEQSYFLINKFDSLNGDDLLVKDKQKKLLEVPQFSSGTLRNISNLKLAKQASSFLSRSKLTSIANLQMPQQQSNLNQSQTQSKTSHVKFPSNQKIVSKNFVYSKNFDEKSKKYLNKIQNYFVEEESMQNYVSNIIKLNQVLENLTLYDDFTITQEESLFIVERNFAETIDFSAGGLTRNQLKNNHFKLLDYLHFIAKIYQKIDNIFIDPEDVHLQNDEFYLFDFKYRQTTPFQIILATLQWVFKGIVDLSQHIDDKSLKISAIHQKTIQECFYRRDELQNSSSFPFYLRELWKNLVNKKINRNQLLPYIERLKFKAIALSMKIDSFHACLNHRRTWTFHEQKHCWLIGKRQNQIYFYNLADDHRCQVKVVRKKKKIDLSDIKICFDPDELQIKYIGENSKLILHIAQFQLQKSSCKSDIEIKHRLPVKFKNPYIFYSPKKQQLFILQNSVYKYSVIENKLYQQTKKISDSIFLARSHDFEFMVVRMSIDIFREGISVFLNQNEVVLFFVGSQQLLDEMSNVRVDIRSVEFCKQVYKGVYLMMASRNIWILDLNFNIFYSYATIERVKGFYGFASVANTTSVSKTKYNRHRRTYSKTNDSGKSNDYAFQIFNQPFKVQFFPHQDGLNVRVKDDQLHVIGSIDGNVYYLRYSFLPEAGSLKLIDYKPLMGMNNKKDQPQLQGKWTKQSKQKESKEHKKVNIDLSHVQYLDQSRNGDEQKKQTIKQPIVNKPKVKPGRRSRNSKLKQLNNQYLQAAPLVVDTQKHQLYSFNFHQENLPVYKNQCWLYFEDKYFIRVEDFYLKTNKTNYEIQLKVKKTTCSLKDLIQKMKKYNENKASKDRKYFSREQCILYMIRCLDIYLWLVRKEFYHKNISIANFYFMKDDNSLKLIGWSQPSRNWYVSDYKDLLLVFFNIVTCNTLQKLNQKLLYKYKQQLQEFSVVYDKMVNAFKLMKVSQKRGEIQKQAKEIKDYLYGQLSNRYLLGIEGEEVESLSSMNKNSEISIVKQMNFNRQLMQSEFIFSFEYHTPRFTMMSLNRKKIKKMLCLIDQNSKEEFIFQSSDKYLWDAHHSHLYIFTSTYQFYELKINTNSFKEETIICEEYQYLPNNILDSSFILVPKYGILSIGGVYKAKDTQLTFNKVVYQFNPQKLTWDPVALIPEPRINPHLVLSFSGQQIFILGGQIHNFSKNTSLIKLSLKPDPKIIVPPFKYTAQILEDPFNFNPFSQLSAGYPNKIYHLSQQNNLYVIFSITAQKYVIRLFSLNSFCVDFTLDTKNYSDDNKNISSSVGITLNKDTIHVLRQYGKLTKINLNKFETLILTNETIYPQRQDKAE